MQGKTLTLNENLNSQQCYRTSLSTAPFYSVEFELFVMIDATYCITVRKGMQFV